MHKVFFFRLLSKTFYYSGISEASCRNSGWSRMPEVSQIDVKEKTMIAKNQPESNPDLQANQHYGSSDKAKKASTRNEHHTKAVKYKPWYNLHLRRGCG